MVKKFLSFGAGTQSTALLGLVLAGEIERPDYVVFADTGSEMPHTYRIVEEMKRRCEEANLPFVTVAHDQPLHEAYYDKGGLPVIGIRSCTSKWKIEPINRFMRSIVGMGRGKVLAEVWIGITTEERKRATPSTNQWTTRRYPLLELEMSRDDCIYYTRKRMKMKVEKSGCFLCPYQHAQQWNRLKATEPELFAKALMIEQKARSQGFKGGLWGSSRSIVAFDHNATLEDYGFSITIEHEKCAVEGSCFL